ncbi:MAG: hypothetical protein IKO46_12970 [Salinivirgaceae bacterium]|nr:hypothetical protein [Salinivirgaceae bacterium]
MFVFRKARNPTKVLNDLDAYINSQSTEPIKWLAREVQSWNEFSYEELEAAIRDGRLEDLIDWQARYAAAINTALAPQWAQAIEAASKKASRGKTILSNTEDWVKAWLTAHGAELAKQLSDESKKAIANVLLKWQGELLRPREMAYQIRPLIGLNERQAIANANYRAKVYQRLIDDGVTPAKAAQRADNAAVRYASKQHRYRAETIVNTELAFAYNQGAHEVVSRSIKDGYMNHCEMVWTTAGTNRVCSRCLELKDTVVGRTDESGVTLPPLHPRCRCAIMYREVGAPRGTSKPSRTIDLTAVDNLVGSVIKPNNSPLLNALLKKYATTEYIVIDETSVKFMYYDVSAEKIIYNPKHINAAFYDKTSALTHEITHLIDYEFGISVSLMNKIYEATEEARLLIFAHRAFYEELMEGTLGDNMAVSDLVSAITDSEIYGAFAHTKEYWNKIGTCEREIVAELATIFYLDDEQGRTFIEAFPKLNKLFEEVKKHYERSTQIAG